MIANVLLIRPDFQLPPSQKYCPSFIVKIKDFTSLSILQHVMASSSTARLAATSQNIPPISSLQALTGSDLESLIHSNAKYKLRSEETTLQTHLPYLSAASPDQYTSFLIGTSMLERFKSTGHDLTLGNHPHIFNAGCGGDTIPNVLYRLSRGLLSHAACKNLTNVKMVIVNIGSNDFRKKGKGLSTTQIYQFCIIVEAIRRAFPTARVVITEIFGRKDFCDPRVIQESNAELEKAMQMMGEGIEWLAAPSVDFETDYEDHVHLNRRGYEIWDAWLVQKLEL